MARIWSQRERECRIAQPAAPLAPLAVDTAKGAGRRPAAAPEPLRPRPFSMPAGPPRGLGPPGWQRRRWTRTLPRLGARAAADPPPGPASIGIARPARSQAPSPPASAVGLERPRP